MVMLRKTKRKGDRGDAIEGPETGEPVRSSKTGRPVMAALDLLGRRWALRILWELQSEPLGARTLLSRCEGLSPSVLYDRLRELTEAGLIAAKVKTMRSPPWAAALRRRDSSPRRLVEAVGEAGRLTSAANTHCGAIDRTVPNGRSHN